MFVCLVGPRVDLQAEQYARRLGRWCVWDSVNNATIACDKKIPN